MVVEPDSDKPDYPLKRWDVRIQDRRPRNRQQRPLKGPRRSEAELPVLCPQGGTQGMRAAERLA